MRISDWSSDVCSSDLAGNLAGSALTCTAGEFTTDATFTVAPGSPAFCTAGDVFIMNASLSLSGSNADRYDIGFFVGQQGNDPKATTAGGICSAAVFPTSPSPFLSKDTDSCGDFLGNGVAEPLVTGIKVVCQGGTGAAESNLTVPYTLTYQQNAGNVCSSPSTVVPAGMSKSKSNYAAADVQIDRKSPRLNSSH